MSIEIITGDDVDIPVFVEVNSVFHPVDTASTVRAALRDEEGELITSPVTMLSTDAGSNWPAGRLQFKLPKAVTTLLAPALKGDGVYLEVEIDDPATGLQSAIFKPAATITKGAIS